MDDGRCVHGLVYGGCVRWELLFADLEAQAEAEGRADLEVEVADRARAELAGVALADRVRAHLGRPLVWHLADGSVRYGTVADVGRGWVLLDAADGPELVVLAGVAGVEGLGAGVAPEEGLAARLPLAVMLRRLAQDRAAVRLVLRSGPPVTGTLLQVAADHCDVHLGEPGDPHGPGHPGGPGGGRGVDGDPRPARAAVRSVPLGALVAVTPA